MDKRTTDTETLNAIDLQAKLKEALDAGILSTDRVLDIAMAAKREQDRKIHTYAITPPAKEEGRWQTCYKGTDGKRKNIKAPTKEELLDKLIPLCFQDLYAGKLTFYQLYEDWLEYKKTVTNSPTPLNGINSTTANIWNRLPCMTECSRG